MKKGFLKIATVVVLLLGLCIPAAAEDVDVSNEVDSLRYYFYNQGAELQTLQSYGSYGFVALNSIRFFRSGQDFSPLLSAVPDTTVGKAQRLLEQLAFDMEPDGYAQLEQQPDGSFADCSLEENIYCFTVLEAVQRRLEGQNIVVYSSKNALNWLLSQQAQDGSFGADAAITAKAVSYLSVFDKKEQIDLGVSYIQSKLDSLQTVEDISDVICGLVDAGADVGMSLPSALIEYKQPDGSFGDKNASLHALAAFDSLAVQSSPFKKLMLNGSFSENLLEQLMPVLIGYGVVAAVAVGVWLYILFGRKKVRRADSDSIFKNPAGMTRQDLEKELEQSE